MSVVEIWNDWMHQLSFSVPVGSAKNGWFVTVTEDALTISSTATSPPMLNLRTQEGMVGTYQQIGAPLLACAHMGIVSKANSLSLGLGQVQAITNGSMSGPACADGEVWRTSTGGFLSHGNAHDPVIGGLSYHIHYLPASGEITTDNLNTYLTNIGKFVDSDGKKLLTPTDQQLIMKNFEESKLKAAADGEEGLRNLIWGFVIGLIMATVLKILDHYKRQPAHRKNAKLIQVCYILLIMFNCYLRYRAWFQSRAFFNFSTWVGLISAAYSGSIIVAGALLKSGIRKILDTQFTPQENSALQFLFVLAGLFLETSNVRGFMFVFGQQAATILSAKSQDFLATLIVQQLSGKRKLD